MSTSFTRRIEDFTCAHCGVVVKGNGYTNHCPHCLWSKHVDVEPGDRASDCGGMMEPVAIRVTREGYDLLHRCTVCRHEKWNRTTPEDDMAEVIKVSAHPKE